MQNFESLPDMLPASFWAKVADPNSAPADSVLHMLVAHIIRLTGRCLTEHSLKLLTSLWLWLSNPNAMNLTNDQKRAEFRRVKSEFNRVAKISGDPFCYISKLPDSPEELSQDYPVVFASVFNRNCPQRRPARCPLDLGELRALNATFRCRGLGAEGAKPATVTDLVPAGTEQPAIACVTQFMMQAMQQMQSMHMQSLGSRCTRAGGDHFM